MENNIVFQIGDGQFTYRVAAIILYEDNILLVQNKEYDCYYTVGGKVKFGESTEEAVLREVMEETQCKYEIERLAFIQERFFCMGNSEHHEVIFYYRMKENEQTKYLHGKYTDQGASEKLCLLNTQELQYKKIIPAFFKLKDLKEKKEIGHIISKEY